MIKSVLDCKDLQGKRVLVRVDWSDGEEFNIRASEATLKYLFDSGAKKIMLATHIDARNSKDLSQYVPEGTEILPNLRADHREEANSEDFARELASRADIYVNEAFSVSHREHASIVGVPKLLPSYVGIRFMEEVENLSKAFNPPHPFLLILGGAKFETKLPLVERFLNIADKVFIAGAMAAQVPKTLSQNPKIVLPVGDITALDADKNVIAQLRFMIDDASFVLWNGPLGKYEEGYKEGTLQLAQILATCGEHSRTIVGGGDTLAAIAELNLLDKFSFVSTGGGAMLDFLATGTLPGIEALK